MDLQPESGTDQSRLNALGLDQLAVPWLGDVRFALTAIIVAAIWHGIGSWVLLISAGIDRIPADLPDAARVDGASDWQVFRSITIPLLWEVLRILLVLWIIQAMQAFTFIYVMTGPVSVGGPLGSTDVMVTYVYRIAFTDFKWAYGAALATAMLVMIFVLSASSSTGSPSGRRSSTESGGRMARAIADASVRDLPANRRARTGLAPPGTLKFTAIYVVLGLYCLFSLIVFLWVVLTSFKTNTEILMFPPWHLPETLQWSNFQAAWERGVGTMFRNSLIVAGLGTLGSVGLACLAAYPIARIPFRFNQPLLMFFLIGIMIPYPLTAIPLYQIVESLRQQHTWINVYLILIVLYTAGGVSFNTFVMTGFYKTLPFELEEAAALDGASPLRTFWQVMLPLARPGIASLLILNFVSLVERVLLCPALHPRPRAVHGHARADLPRPAGDLHREVGRAVRRHDADDDPGADHLRALAAADQPRADGRSAQGLKSRSRGVEKTVEFVAPRATTFDVDSIARTGMLSSGCGHACSPTDGPGPTADAHGRRPTVIVATRLLPGGEQEAPLDPVATGDLKRIQVHGEGDVEVQWAGVFVSYGGHGADQSTTIVFEIEPGKRLGWHTDQTEETQYIIAGTGELRTDAGVFPVGPTSVFVVPTNVGHDLVNTGTETMRCVAFFAAAMFTQKFDNVMQPLNSHVLGTPNREG